MLSKRSYPSAALCSGMTLSAMNLSHRGPPITISHQQLATVSPDAGEGKGSPPKDVGAALKHLQGVGKHGANGAAAEPHG